MTARFFFIHVMRTGGTTFEQQLRRHFPRDQVYPNPDCDLPGGDVLRHLDLSYLLALPPERRAAIRLYYGHFPSVATEMLGVDTTTLTLLRDPVERTISLLRVMRERRPALAGLTLEQVYDDGELFPRLIHNHQTKLFSMTRADHPQSYLDEVDVDGARLERAKANLARVDVVGITERYGEFVEGLRARFGWRFNEEARMNAALESPVEPPGLRRRIVDDNGYDIELYEYARTLLNR